MTDDTTLTPLIEKARSGGDPESLVRAAYTLGKIKARVEQMERLCKRDQTGEAA